MYFNSFSPKSKNQLIYVKAKKEVLAENHYVRGDTEPMFSLPNYKNTLNLYIYLYNGSIYIRDTGI